MKSLLDKKFVYTQSINTNIRKTFERVLAEQERLKSELELKVSVIRTRAQSVNER